MSSPPSTLWDEARLAAVGTVRMITGRRDAPAYFGEDSRALVGSLLALVAAVVISLLLNALLVSMIEEAPPVSSLETVLTTALTFMGQVGGTFLVFRTLGRIARFVPYLVADNWTSFYLSVLTALLGFFGVGLDVTLLAVGLVTLVAKINIARLTGLLGVPGIVLLLVGQVIGAGLALVMIAAMVGPVPV